MHLRTLMRPASPFQSLDLKEDNTEAEACFVSAEATATAAVDLRRKEAKNPGKGVCELMRWAASKQTRRRYLDSVSQALHPRFETWEQPSPERSVVIFLHSSGGRRDARGCSTPLPLPQHFHRISLLKISTKRNKRRVADPDGMGPVNVTILTFVTVFTNVILSKKNAGLGFSV
jgi:hypothetical protein